MARNIFSYPRPQFLIYPFICSSAIRVFLVLPAMTEFLDSLAFLDLQAPLDLLALAE